MVGVAPLVGAWIEIGFGSKVYGTKFVAPLVGAWIEMELPYNFKKIYSRRAPRGRVD